MTNIYPDLVKKSPVRAVGPNATVREAAEIMTKYDIGAVLVKDRHSILGIFTERDLVTRIVSKGKSPKTTRVNDVMTPNPVTIHKSAKATEALEHMNEKGYRHLPVVDDAGKVVGMISIRGLYKSVQKELSFENQQNRSFIFGSAYGTGGVN